MTTAGRVARSGIVKLRLLTLLTALVHTRSLRVLHSMVHTVLTDYIVCILQLNSKALMFDMMRNAKLPSVIIKGLVYDDRQFHGYSGHFLHIAATIQQRLETASSTESMFASTCIDKHDITKHDWDSFYSQLLAM